MPNIKSQKDRVVQAAAEQAHNKAIKLNPVRNRILNGLGVQRIGHAGVNTISGKLIRIRRNRSIPVNENNVVVSQYDMPAEACL